MLTVFSTTKQMLGVGSPRDGLAAAVRSGDLIRPRVGVAPLSETDGREWHEGDAFERDRRRDLVTARTRYRTLRFTRRQVLFGWPSVRNAVLAALAG